MSYDTDGLDSTPPPPPAGGPEGWQYKIVRGYYTKREAIERAVAEQADFGWSLVEVLDVTRIRFGRTRQAAEKDVAREGNPYAMCSSRRRGGTLQTLLILGGAFAFSLLMAALLSSIRELRVPATPPPTAVAIPTVFAPGPRAPKVDEQIREEVRRQVDEALRPPAGRVD